MYMLLNILNVQAHYNQVNENKISFILVYESYRNFKYILVNCGYLESETLTHLFLVET